MKKIIAASTSTVHGSGYLEYLSETLSTHFANVQELLFVPFARPGGISYDRYTAIATKAFDQLGITVKGLHQFDDPVQAVQQAQGIFTGGGNTFVLVDQLYRHRLIQPLRQAINSGTPYLGTSAGSNICGPSMRTTNDMPIVYPPSFQTLGVLPFNLNPHYLDPDPNSTHMGETRETRINEFHTQNETLVIGLREGSWIEMHGTQLSLKGPHTARLFRSGMPATELPAGSDLGQL